MSADLPPPFVSFGPVQSLIYLRAGDYFTADQMRAYATAALASQAAEVEALRKRAETWELLYMRAINEANGLTNYVEDRPELSKIERKLVAIEAAARAALKEQAPNPPAKRRYASA